MPRTRFDKKRNEALSVLVHGYIYKDGGNAKQAATKVQMDHRTLCRRLQKPGDFTVDELLDLCRKYHVPIDELRAALRY